jgi:hypothetical protein
MAVGAFTTVTNALKQVYSTKRVEAMINEETPFRAWLKKSVPAGTRVREGIVKFGANLAPPQNTGQILDGGTLPLPKDRTQDQFELYPTLFPGTFQIGWLTRRAGNTSKSAFNGGELRRKTEETLADTGKFIEQTYCGTDNAGTRCQVNAATTSLATFVAKKPQGVLLLRVNQFITSRTSQGGNSSTVSDSCDYVKITAITESSNTVTLASGHSLAANDYIMVVTETGQDSMTSINANGTPGNGLRGLVDDTTHSSHLHKLSRTTYPQLNAVVEANGGVKRDLSEQILVNACQTIRHRSGKQPTDMWSNTGQAQMYVKFVAPDRRYAQSGSGITEMGTGYQKGSLVHYAPGIRLVLNESVDIVPREIFLLNRENIFHYVAQEMGWWDEGGGPLLKPVPATNSYKAAWFAALCSMENIGTDFPRAHAVIRDLNDPLNGD